MMRRTSTFVVALGLALGAGTVLAKKPVIVDEGGIGKHWKAAPGATFPAPGYPAQMKERGATVCLSIAYTVDENGVPGELMLMDSWSRDAQNQAMLDDDLEPFVQSAGVTLLGWRFAPREEGKPVAVRTTATMVFNASAGMPAGEIVQNCRTKNLQARLDTRRGRRMDEATRTYLSQTQTIGSDRARADAESAAIARDAARTGGN